MNGTAPSRLPQRGSRGGCHSSNRSETRRLRAISPPLRKLRNFTLLPFIGVHFLSLAFARQLPQGGSRGWAVPFDVPPGNREVAGDFHRPYEGSESFTFYHPTGYSLNRGVSGDFHRPYETQKLSPLRNFRFLTQKRYRVGQGTCVWEPAQSVTEIIWISGGRGFR